MPAAPLEGCFLTHVRCVCALCVVRCSQNYHIFWTDSTLGAFAVSALDSS